MTAVARGPACVLATALLEQCFRPQFRAHKGQRPFPPFTVTSRCCPRPGRWAPAHVCDEVTGCRELHQAVPSVLPPCSLVARLLGFAFLLLQNGVVDSLLGDVFVDVHAHIVHFHFHVDVVTRLLLAPRVGWDCPR